MYPLIWVRIVSIFHTLILYKRDVPEEAVEAIKDALEVVAPESYWLRVCTYGSTIRNWELFPPRSKGWVAVDHAPLSKRELDLLVELHTGDFHGCVYYNYRGRSTLVRKQDTLEMEELLGKVREILASILGEKEQRNTPTVK